MPLNDVSPGVLGQKIFDQTLVADAATLDSGVIIPGAFAMLKVFTITQTADAGAGHSVNFNVNNDTGSNYDLTYVYCPGPGTPSGGNGGVLGAAWGLDTHGQGGTAQYPAMHEFTFPNYSGTNFYKTGSVVEARNDATSGNCIVLIGSIGWRNTAAINRFAINATGSNLKAGTRLILMVI